jgi:hypothetical protein
MAPKKPPALVLATLIAAGVVTVQALLVALFAWPAANAEPRDLPVAVAGPAPAAEQFAAQLRAQRPGAFDITTVPDAAAADQALRGREAYAAFVLGPDGVALHTASAASPTVATLLTQAAGQLSGATGGTGATGATGATGGTGAPVRVTDVVPGDPDDPRGAGFAAGFLPLALTSLVAGAALTAVVASRSGRLFGLVAYALLAGLVGTLVLQQWLGVLPDQYLASAAAIGLFALAAGATVAGLGSVLGRRGIGLGALLVFLIGNPLSAVSAAPQLLPQPWGEVGQWLPVGAGGTLLRSATYFDWAGAAFPAAVLAGYAMAGLALVAAGRPPHVGKGPLPSVPAADLRRVRAVTTT